MGSVWHMATLDARMLLRSVALGVLAASVSAPAANADVSGWRVRAGRPPAPAVLTRLPGQGNQLALTIDDGCSTAVVAAFAQFCRDSGTRLTFFVNGVNRRGRSMRLRCGPWWSPVRCRWAITRGRIRISPGSVSTPSPTRSVATRPSCRTPTASTAPVLSTAYGRHSPDTDRVAADLGYPTVALWSGDVGDSRVINEQQLVANATISFQPQTDHPGARQSAPDHALLRPAARPHSRPRPANRHPGRRVWLTRGLRQSTAPP